MRDKKMFLSVILITAAMLFVGGCGNAVSEPVSAEMVETVTEVDTEESTEESVEPPPSPTVEPEESMESSETPDNSEKETDATEVMISIDDTVMYATANCNIRSGAGTQYDKVGSLSYAQEVTVNGKVEAGEDKLWYIIKTEDGSAQMVSASMLSETKPVAQTSSINGSGSSGNSGGSTGDTGNSEPEKPTQTEQTAPVQTTPVQTVPTVSEPVAAPAPTLVPTPVPTPTPEPVHEHTWKDHTATKQAWVPNIVVVDDYETQYVTVGYLFICNCGFETTDRNAIVQHTDNHFDTGEMDNFTIQNVYGEESVWVGSHEEDQGYYETSTYVDYQYCECGATK